MKTLFVVVISWFAAFGAQALNESKVGLTHQSSGLIAKDVLGYERIKNDRLLNPQADTMRYCALWCYEHANKSACVGLLWQPQKQNFENVCSGKVVNKDANSITVPPK